jgi:hypothetical protein
MSNRLIFEDWLAEQDMPALGGQPDPSAGQAPSSQPDVPPSATTDQPSGMQPNQNDPNIANQDQPQDISQDPQVPDMPEEKEDEDFETWKMKYFRATVKGDSNELIDILNEKREDKGLEESQSRFIENNFSIQLLRQYLNIESASKEIRKLMKENLDRNNPASSLVNHIYSVLETIPQLNNMIIKCKGYGNLKADLHRKFIAALLCAVQVGTGANSEDLIVNEKDEDGGYSVLISTRFNSKWGDVNLGDWSLKEDDVDRYLSEAERKRLEDGSPEEKDVLRRRVVLESIADQYKQRAFIINVVGEDGTIFTLGWDMFSALKQAYNEGRLVVRTRLSDNSEAMITDEGKIVSFMDWSINYIRETGEQDEEGQPAVEELEFMQRRNGRLYLVAALDTIRDAAQAPLAGTTFQETPYRGNPSDLKILTRCVFTAYDMLIKQC